ncbi:MAG: NAD(P)-dependent glycerol-3-phosphate dehydrogenase [Alphaproteobacteria bacterium]|nr:NAD(P)-dependent glycerol-3-phosphate dehydrogenase [Alphaproteobacteria bacterium]
MTKISVIGAGAWGTALAQTYAKAGHQVTLWVREESLAQTMIESNRNASYLPDIDLDPRLAMTTDITVAVQADVILNVVPAQYIRQNLQLLAPLLRDKQPVVICAKGIEIASHSLLSDVFAEECPKAKLAFLTGPNFAGEIASGLPSASTLACADAEVGGYLQEALTAKNLRLYLTSDIIGAQVAGAIKNVIAIACGIASGLGLGESARAALVTRGLAEMSRLTVALGGDRTTLMGQCGVGDMMLTCSSMKSRNFSCGVALAQGQTMDQIVASRNSVTEGISTAKAAIYLMDQYKVDMPIVRNVYACLYEGLSVQDAVTAILNRPARMETV